MGHQRHVVTSRDAPTGALIAHNPYNTGFADRVAFSWASEPVRSMTGDRTEFIGRNRTLTRPAALTSRVLSNRLGAGLDPCGALQVNVTLEPGETREFVFLLGEGSSIDEVRALIGRCGELSSVEAARRDVDALWQRTLGAIQVQTPDDSFDLLMNGWLLHQTLSSRVWARTGFYQPGGAFGFRDQLQDVMALVFMLGRFDSGAAVRHRDCGHSCAIARLPTIWRRRPNFRSRPLETARPAARHATGAHRRPKRAPAPISARPKQGRQGGQPGQVGTTNGMPRALRPGL